MVLFWLAVGIMTVGFTYLSSPHVLDPWDSLNLAGIVAGVYLLILLAVTLRRPFSRRFLVLAWAGTLVTGAAIVSSWTGYDTQSHYQATVLSQIREKISRGIIAGEISSPLLKALETYYAQSGSKKGSLGMIFREQTSARIGTNIHNASHESDHLSIVVAALSHDEVILVAQEGLVKGHDARFRNLDGATGMIQEIARLTPQGIDYESQN